VILLKPLLRLKKEKEKYQSTKYNSYCVLFWVLKEFHAYIYSRNILWYSSLHYAQALRNACIYIHLRNIMLYGLLCYVQVLWNACIYTSEKYYVVCLTVIPSAIMKCMHIYIWEISCCMSYWNSFSYYEMHAYIHLRNIMLYVLL